MQILWIILSVLGGLALLALLYVLSTMCRKGHKGLENLRVWSYAIGVCMATAFRKTAWLLFGQRWTADMVLNWICT